MQLFLLPLLRETVDASAIDWKTITSNVKTSSGEVEQILDEMVHIDQGTSGKYELILLHPPHILIGGFPVIIKHSDTGEFTHFYTSKYEDGVLREDSPTGPPLPGFSSRGAVPLNPILVNFAAAVRIRRLVRKDLAWGSTFNEKVIRILTRVTGLDSAVLWGPPQPHEARFHIEVPGSQPPLVYDLRRWPFFPTSEAAHNLVRHRTVLIFWT
jgi:hypothetical protein